MIRSLIVLLLLALPLMAGDSASDIIKNVQETYEDIKYLTAEFVQIEEFGLTGAKNEVKGKIYVKGGDKYRLVTEDQVVVTNGETVWTYSVFSGQVLIDRVKENSGSLLPRDLLFKYPKTHYATLLGKVEWNGKTYYNLKLDPREDVHGFVKSMKLWVEPDDWFIDKIEYTDFNDNISVFEIRKSDTKTPLKDDFFNFEIKEGMEVVDLRL